MKTFAEGFRNQSLCIPFQSLHLSGPEGSFDSAGLLVSRGDRIVLEHSPTCSRSEIPNTRGDGMFGPEHWWKAEGVTLHGLYVLAEDLLPPSHEWSNTNGHWHYSTKVRRLRVSRKPIQIEKGQINAPRAEDTKESTWYRASIAGAKLDLHNESQTHEEKNPFFEGTYHSWSEGTWVGEVQDWRFCFRTEKDDLFVHLETKPDCKQIVNPDNGNRLTGLLNAFSFMQGGSVVPWRVQHTKDDVDDADVFSPHFNNPFSTSTPIGGIKLHDSGLVMSMFAKMADYFSAGSVHVDQMRQYLWQLQQAGHRTDIRLYSCMHLCAIFEGVCNEMLVHKLGWSKTKVNKTRALERFRELAAGIGFKWEYQFEPIVQIWKSLRDDLAHGNIFGGHGAWNGDLFALKSLVTGGIQAFMLADAGWQEPIDFSLLRKTSHLYYQ